MAWERDGRSYSPTDMFCSVYDDYVSAALELQPDYDYWMVPPRTKHVVTSIKNYRQRGIDNLQVYIDRCLSAPWEISHIEREFEIQLGEVLVRGAIDRILYYPYDESYLLEDLKSGSPKGEDDVRQLAFYAMVARELWDIPVFEGRYWFSKLDRGSTIKDLSRYDKNFWVQEFKDLDKGINSGVFLASPGDHCQLCDVRPWCNQQGWLKIGEPLK